MSKLIPEDIPLRHDPIIVYIIYYIHNITQMETYQILTDPIDSLNSANNPFSWTSVRDSNPLRFLKIQKLLIM